MAASHARGFRSAAIVALIGLAGCGNVADTVGLGGTGFSMRDPAGLRKTPFAPSLSVAFTRTELGYGHTCGLTADARAFCMGDNEYGQLGSSAPMQRCKSAEYPCSPTPLAVDGGLAFVQLGADIRVTCGLTTDGDIFCWGFGVGGQLGDGLRQSSPTPVKAQSAVRFRYLGRGQAANNLCAISEAGRIYCWGISQDGQGGNGSLDATPVPTAVASNLTFRATGSGQSFACALADSGDIYCWGRNTFGKLGTGVVGSTTIPALVAGGLKYTAIAVGGQHACALTTTGAAYCWGSSGAVGGAAPAEGANTPRAVEGGLVLKSLTAGYQHTCAIDSADQAWCWGANGVGTLGDGTTADRTVPVRVSSREKFASLSAGGTATCGITLSGRLLCWGLNSYGQLGFPPGDP